MPFVVLFSMETCPHCIELKKNLSDGDKENLLDKMILIKSDNTIEKNNIEIDDETLKKIKQFGEEKTKESGFPVLMKFGDDGTPLTKTDEYKGDRKYELIKTWMDETPATVGGKRFRQRKTFFKRRHHKTNKHYSDGHPFVKHGNKRSDGKRNHKKTKKSWWNIFGL
jgi:glutaredoxin